MFLKGYLIFFFLSFAFAYSSGNEYDDLWKIYQVKYNKKYSLEEDKLRRTSFEQNAALIAKHNLEADYGIHSYRMELNTFSDKTPKELRQYRECLKGKKMNWNSTKIYDSNCYENCSTLPAFVDWRKQGLVTPVKNQGNCGSCWAFSSTGSLEGQAKKKYGKLISLSEQNLVDCSKKEGNAGCNGGWMEYAFQYVIDNRGIDTEEVYKYRGMDGKCRFKRNGIGAKCTAFHRIKQGSETNLQTAVANIGPISVAIDATDNFMFYKSGIFYDGDCMSSELNHGVLVVGYGSKNGTDYWIVKNSWGSDWGMNGYILMARNKRNNCGIASHALYPVV